MSAESRAINQLMEEGMTRREANHAVRTNGEFDKAKARHAVDKAVSRGRTTRRKERAAAEADALANGGTVTRRTLMGGRLTRGNRREY